MKVKDVLNLLENNNLFSVCVHADFDYCLYFKNGKIDKQSSDLYENTIENILDYEVKSYEINTFMDHFEVYLTFDFYT